MPQLDEQLILWVAIGSGVMFVGGLIALPIIVVWLPADYFSRKNPPILWGKAHPVFRFIVLILRNVLGFVILVAGIIMLFTPGQGVLSILVGLMLLTFPGKRILERKLISTPSIHKGFNLLRARYGVKPLELGPDEKEDNEKKVP